MASSKFKQREGIKNLFMEFREGMYHTSEKNIIRENVSVNIEEKMYQVGVNEFASWVLLFNKIEEYEFNDEESSNNKDEDSVETQSNEGSFGHVQETSNELNEEVLNLKSDRVDAVNLEDVTLDANDKLKVD
ncbi:hypothetical protein L1987_64814 [Smallanthus sonchifolius]|uniref:Uncharacterized protein n=1 Tax=Smallanthus sonchifolius TaxID=185202 RepID=A0ACB9BSL5_9ASTR|nr:hypothetical protein L1987_64814 [Smallanthus sonchifolius]